MFDQLFRYRSAVARYGNGPMLEERLAFLTHLASQGYSRSTLRKDARRLLVVARMLGLATEVRGIPASRPDGLRVAGAPFPVRGCVLHQAITPAVSEGSASREFAGLSGNCQSANRSRPEEFSQGPL